MDQHPFTRRDIFALIRVLRHVSTSDPLIQQTCLRLVDKAQRWLDNNPPNPK